MLQIKARIVDNKKVSDNYFRLSIEAAKIIREARPGQFMQVKVSAGYEPLLRRPFGIHRVKKSTIEILYEVVGRGTQALSQKTSSEYLDIIGPLGNGFTYREPRTENRTPILVAGGMGVAPLLFLAEKIVSNRLQAAGCRLRVLIGAKTKSHILCTGEFKQLGCEVKIATDDGSAGFKGKVTDLLKILLSTIDYGLSTIYACGPKPMLKELALISSRHNIPAQVSLEAHMACGFGACLGCAINTKQGLKKACQDGPVFNPDEVIWQ